MRPTRRPIRLVLAGLAALVAGSGLVAPAAQAANSPVPRNFTGYGFDQCAAPSRAAMDAWLTSSPYWAVGIYISGKSRACRTQTNLTPTWVSTQIRNGWRLLPITLGPQASCSTRFPRYGNDPVINADPANNYARARAMGRAEGRDAVSVAKGLGIVPGSTLWYDLEGFDTGRTPCRESALRFTSAWTRTLHQLGYVSGFYSSASTGIRMLDDVRVNRPRVVTLPDRVWIADWNQRADVESSYVRSDGWKPGGRVHQYAGNVTETWGGVRIPIDRNFLDLGVGSKAVFTRSFCGGLRINWPFYATQKPGMSGDQAKALQCLMSQQGFYDGPVNGSMDAPTVAAVRAVRAARHLPDGAVAGRRVWLTLHTYGTSSLMKYGAAGEPVRRLQRGLNTLYPRAVGVSGVFDARTTAAVKRYQAARGLVQTGVVVPALWDDLKAARRF